jgi:hypothetical protein
MCATSSDIDTVKRRTTAHEELVSFGATKANVGTNFGQQDLSDPLSLWVENVHSVIAFSDPASAGPNVTGHVRPDAVGKASLGLCVAFIVSDVEHHGSIFPAIFQIGLFDDVPDFYIARSIVIMTCTGIGDI